MKIIRKIKSKLAIICVLGILVSCTQDQKSTEQTEEISTNTSTSNAESEIADVPYYAEMDSSSQNFTLIKSDLVQQKDLSASNIKNALNKKYPEIIITDTKISNDTIYVNIPNAKQLTQGIGSMGAKIYMTEATYSFTDLSGIKFVKYNFVIGDHAFPGVYTKEDFKFVKTSK